MTKEELVGTLENLMGCLEKRFQAQLRLIDLCSTKEEINLYKAQGFFDYDEGSRFYNLVFHGRFVLKLIRQTCP